MPIATVRLTDEQAAWITAQTTQYRKKADVIRDLIDTARQGLTASDTLVQRRGDDPRGEDPLSEASKAVSSSSTKKTKNSSIKSIPPSLQAHDDLIGAFWKTKAGSKSEAGWKLLMTELQKIQEKYGDRVVRDQLELAAASRWKGVSLRNYEQFGINTPGQPQRRSETDWDAIEAAMPKTPW